MAVNAFFSEAMHVTKRPTTFKVAGLLAFRRSSPGGQRFEPLTDIRQLGSDAGHGSLWLGL